MGWWDSDSMAPTFGHTKHLCFTHLSCPPQNASFCACQVNGYRSRHGLNGFHVTAVCHEKRSYKKKKMSRLFWNVLGACRCTLRCTILLENSCWLQSWRIFIETFSNIFSSIGSLYLTEWHVHGISSVDDLFSSSRGMLNLHRKRFDRKIRAEDEDLINPWCSTRDRSTKTIANGGRKKWWENTSHDSQKQNIAEMSFVDGSDVIQSTLSCHDARECFIIMSGANGAKYVFSVRIALRETQHWYVFTKCIFFCLYMGQNQSAWFLTSTK